MDNITKIQSIVENIGRANKILMSSSLIEEHKQELYEVLLNMSKTPLEYDKIFTEYCESLASRERYNNKEKISIPKTLAERKENIQQAFSIIQDIIPKLEKQLESMKNKGYFVPEEKITQYRAISRDQDHPMKKSPSLDVIGFHVDMYSSPEVPIKIKFTKKEFTLNDIDSLIKKLKSIKKESDLFIKSLKSIDLPKNPFAKSNIQQAQEKCLQNKKEMMGVYKVINSQFGIGDIPFLDQEVAFMGKEHVEVIKREDKTLICTIPEMGTLSAIRLTGTKDISNPEYPKIQDQWKQLKETIDQISAILLSTKE